MRTARTAARMFWRRVGVLLPILAFHAPGLSLGASPVASERVLVLDFESQGLSGWEIRKGDEPYLRRSIAGGEDALVDGGSLLLQSAGWDTTRPANESVLFTYRLREPIPVDWDTEASWVWWIGDREINDGVGITFLISGPDPSPEAQILWLSHSLFLRGPISFDDPECESVRHRVPLLQRLRTAPRPAVTKGPYFLTGVAIELVYPRNQRALIDAIRIGPAASHPESMTLNEPLTAAQPRATSVLAADLDGDGLDDQLIGQLGEPPVLRFGKGNGSSHFVPGSEAGLDSAVSLVSPRASDLDGDGRLDLICLTGGQVRLFRGLGGRAYLEMPFTKLDRHYHWDPWRVAAADLLPPPGPELIVHRIATFQADSLYQQVAPWRWKAQPLPEPCGIVGDGYRYDAAVADVDRDGDLDLLTCNTDLYLRQGGRLLCAGERWLPKRGRFETGAAFGDVDGDGDIDLVLTADIRGTRPFEPHGADRTTLYLNDGDRYTEAAGRLDGGALNHIKHPILEDFDLDGDLDLFCTQDYRRERSPRIRLRNVYLENDGTGTFLPGQQDSRVAQSPYAQDAVALDADDDGDSDLLLILGDGAQAALVVNDARPQYPPIRLRVLDAHGLPDLSGALIDLMDGQGKIVAHRQTGVGSLAHLRGSVTLGCLSPGPYQLKVAFPSAPRRPFVRDRVHPGDRILIVAPAWDGPLGGFAGRAQVAAFALVARIAGGAWIAILPATALYGACCGGLALLAIRRPFRRLRRTAVFSGLLLCGVLLGSLLVRRWPETEAGRTILRNGVGALAVGCLGGVGVLWLEISRRDALRGRRDPAAIGSDLLEAIDGFSHAGWAKDLSALSSLARSSAEGADPSHIRQRLDARLQSWTLMIRPQLERILRSMETGGIPDRLVQCFRSDFEALDEGIETIRRDGTGRGDRPSLDRFSRAAARMGVTIQELFEHLGSVHRADLAGVLAGTVERAREQATGISLEYPADGPLPPVFGVSGDLGNILENLLANAVRAARANVELRTPRVLVEAGRQGGIVLVRVHDSGPGLSQEELERIRRTRSVEPNAHGRGLAYACRRLHQWDGRLDVQTSSLLGGAAVCVTLRVLKEGGAE